MMWDERNPPRLSVEPEVPPKHLHDVELLWGAGDSHPTAIRCENCDWEGVIDGVR